MMQFAGYVSGRISASEKEKTEKHLSMCGDCLEDIVIAGRILRDLQRQETPLYQRLKDWMTGALSKIGQLFQSAFQRTALQPALQRSESDDYPLDCALIGTFDAFQVRIYCRLTEENTAAVTAVISGALPPVRLTLESIDGMYEDSRPVSKDREVFSSLTFGGYCLFFTSDQSVESKILFRIDEAGCHEV
jgi:hypothetical protein